MGKKSVSILAVLANLLLAVGKTFTGIISKSSAILADGINSGTDVVSSLISFIGIKAAEKPADKEHPYGHGKAEVISGFLITIIIFLSAIYIIYDAIKSFFISEPLSLGILAFIVMGLSALINGLMSQIKIYYGKKYDSFSLISDGLHSRIDLLVSLVIFTGLFLTKYYSNTDSILALIVGIYILKESIILGKKTTDSLLGKNAGKEIENKIKEIIKKEKIELEKLKTQKIGSQIFADIDIKLPAKIKVNEAETIVKKLEQKLTNNIENLDYTSIQIKSHNVGRGYYRTGLGQGKWKKGRFKDKIEEAEREGPGGYCICPKGDYKIKHERGIPCSNLKCPNHNIPLTRKDKIKFKEKSENAKAKKI